MSKSKAKIESPKQSKSVIQISNSIVRDRNISNIEFLILLRLKYLIFENNGSGELHVDITKLRIKLGIADNRTLKRYLNSLQLKGYIYNQVKIERSAPSLVSLNLEMFTTPENQFTQLPLALLSRINTIGHTGIRLLYYFESYINRKIVQNQFCFAAVITICKNTGMGKTTVKESVDILKKEKLLEVILHELKHDDQYNEKDELLYNKYNNHYYVNYNKLEEYENSN